MYRQNLIKKEGTHKQPNLSSTNTKEIVWKQLQKHWKDTKISGQILIRHFKKLRRYNKRLADGVVRSDNEVIQLEAVKLQIQNKTNDNKGRNLRLYPQCVVLKTNEQGKCRILSAFQGKRFFKN